MRQEEEMSTSSLLPAIGREISYSMQADEVPLQMNGLGMVTIDFKGGIKKRIENNFTDGLGGVRQLVVGFEASADHEMLGKVTLRLADTEATPLSLLEITSSQPPTYRETIFLGVQLTIERPPGGGPPLVLSDTRTLQLVSDRLPGFPPQGSVYQLNQPVELARVDDPTQVVATLLQFPAAMSAS
jgi:hypothetical protein